MIPCKIVYKFCLLILFIEGFAQCTQVDNLMSDEDIKNVFHTDRDNVPEHKVVSVQHNLYKRSSSNLHLQFNAFGKKIDAYLNPSDGILAGRYTPVWIARTVFGGKIEHVKLREDIVGIVAGFFNSPIDLSTVVAINERGGDASFEGIINGLTIRPLPEHLQETVRSRRDINSSETTTSRTLLGSRLHVVFKSASLISENKHVKDLEKRISEQRSFNETNSRTKRSKQKVIFPSIMVVTDFAQSKSTNLVDDFAYSKEIIYQLAFWNAVDMRFRQVKDPEIRLCIAGIIIGLDRGAIPYLNENRHGNEINMEDAWPTMEDYWDDQSRTNTFFPPTEYDIIVTMTDSDLIGKADDGSIGNIEGSGANQGLCYRLDDDFYALAVIRDTGGFSSIITAAHELGHVMGLTHDTDSGDECGKSYHYIMQPDDELHPNNLRWSPCSLRLLSQLLRDDSIDCVDELGTLYPPGPAVQRFLPGDIVDPHKQCQSRGYNWACDTSIESCTSLKCYHTQWSAVVNGLSCQDSGPAAEGTICSPDHKCIDGVCQCLTKDCLFENP